ncbi:MAG: hypothetical protein EPO21_00430 [Chloroflexota bacterium]|nr:MAG: hypothetical protein EPO21_00430 [Chloroflexota bacterium]
MPLRIRELRWDNENEDHIARHSISVEEVEQICFGQHRSTHTAYRDRWAVHGQTIGGRYLVVILAEREEPGIYRPITAREMTSAERRRYRQQRR